MKEKWHFIFYLLWFSYLIIAAVLMFGHGFLLSRKTLSDVTECSPLSEISCEDGGMITKEYCNDDLKIKHVSSNIGAFLACAPKRNKVVLILVDALRYDFTEYDERIEKPLYYQNRLPIIQGILKQHPERARLYRFMADPPTTTLQRVKALVTGSLPTFVDASSNFAAMELQEDNLIDQVVMSGGKAVLLGDDTWSRLMPKRWLRSHALYSFHTWDLDTVDNEVDSKIYDELKKKDWDLLVAHYLGVDHAGHRYGPNHPEMARKLKETNNRLQKIIEMLPPDVLLCVIGDHGMTESGDHGGESRAERTAAMFVYRVSGLGDEGALSVGKEVQQTDLAPTLSAALGRPPPAPSLGNILFSVLPKMSKSITLLHLSNNLKQVTKYLIRYGEESQQVSLDKLAHLINATRDQIEKAANVETDIDLQNYVSDVRNLMENIRSTFREVWVEFDSLSMLRALLLLLLAIFFNWLITEGVPFESISNIFASSFVPTGLISLAVCTAVCYTAYYFSYLEDLEHSIILSTGLISGGLTCMLVIMHWDGITQRWYEGRSSFYERFSRAALVASAVILVSNSYVIEEGASLSYLALSALGLLSWNIGNVKAVVCWALCGVTLALSRSYRGCREEQGDCWTAGEGAPTGQASRAALVLALGSVAATVAITRRHVGWRGYGITLGGVLVCAHWAVGWGALGSPAQSKLMAKLAWLVVVVMFILLWKRDGRGATIPLMVLGLVLYLANVLVLGASYAPAAALALLSGFLTLNIVSWMKTDSASKFSLSSRCNSCVACLWALLACYNFYGTGHHATLGHIRWAPVFHAGDPNYISIGPLITVVLTSLHLFGMPFMFGATVPLLLLWGRNGVSTLGSRTQMAAVFSLCLKFALCFAIRVFVCALSATIHCRHLIIWGVFTPKLLFESGACAAAFLGTVLGATLTAWHLPPHQRNS
ncbi:PREDICTED: GPI ethanolamine phosphate transferase 3-like isoform X2 [Papilio xuthus]|uniref:GPI ethanolamine phosphate transferase 3-like isoform X2 n=1 Tax=Papilio xuthus TaxID=66420 RepID=A0AAJ6Z1J1_PAPXU|nr:PREDICTED: GPI ethanolamine phosphate transferase 3-like isoform X2 [Papilio xuthus]